MTETRFISIGSHLMGEEADLSIIILHGVVESEHLAAMHPRSVAMFRRHGYALTLIDATDAKSMTQEARRLGAELNRKSPMLSATAIYGASLFTRTLATLLWRAVSLMANGTFELAFYKTEQDARIWLGAQRNKLRATAAPV